MGANGLVWMVDGDERPFDKKEPERRVWLEDVAAWVHEAPRCQPQVQGPMPERREGVLWL